MESVGSEPIDRRQMSGVRGSDSSHVLSKSRITASAYFCPMESMMYLRAATLAEAGPGLPLVPAGGGCLEASSEALG